MDMWSRIGNLFPRKRVADRVSEVSDPSTRKEEAVPSIATAVDASTKEWRSASEQQIARNTIASDSDDAMVQERELWTNPFIKPEKASTSDPWIAARGRPLVYAHKLRLGANQVQGVADDIARNDSGPVHGSPKLEPEATEAVEVPRNYAARPAAFLSLETQNPGDTLPHVDESSKESGLLAVDHPLELRTQRQPATGRFAMLRVVAEQWRPTVLTCKHLVIVGSANEARAVAPVIRGLQAHDHQQNAVRVCVAGQRTDYIREALALFGVSSDMEISFPVRQASIDELRTGMIKEFGKLLIEVKPDWLLVQGNSVTTAMASMAAYYAHVPVAHIDGETELQNTPSGDESDPEVLHRRIASLFASIHFVDTALEKERLLRDGVPEQYILVTGNTGIDRMHETCAALGLQPGKAAPRASGVAHVLVVVETPETIAHGLPELCRAIRSLATSVPGLYQFVWPVVAHPEGSQLVRDLLDRVPGVLLSGPVRYEQYLRLLNECDLVLTDVEEVQEEAPSLGKPVLLMQSSAHRPEAQRAGITTLTARDAGSLQAAVRTLARKLSVRHGSITNPYGDGRATSRILDFFEGRQVLEFGRTALPRQLKSDEAPASRLLAQSAQ